MIKVRLGARRAGKPGTVVPRGGRMLGEIEEYFAETLTPGDTFLFAGEVLRFEGIHEDEALVTRTRRRRRRRSRPTRAASSRSRPSSPSASAASSPTRRVGPAAAAGRRDWLRAAAPPLDPARRGASCWSRPSRAAAGTTWSAYPFEGRLAHQTLGMLLTRRLERARPAGRSASSPTTMALAVWGLGDLRRALRREPGFLDELFAEDMLGDDLEAWLAEIGPDEAHLPGLRHHRRADRAPLSGPGEDAAGRSRSRPTSSTTCCASTSRDHVLLRRRARRCGNGTPRRAAARRDAARIRGRIIHKPLDRVSPLGVSVMLEIGRERGRTARAPTRCWRRREATLLDEAWRDCAARSRRPARPAEIARRRACAADARPLGRALASRHERALVVADLHLEKGSSFARRGQMLPPYDTRETLARARRGGRPLPARDRRRARRQLPRSRRARPARRRRPRRARGAAGRPALDLGRPATTTAVLPAHVGGEVVEELTLGSPRSCATSRRPAPPGEIAGHLHPVGKVRDARPRRCAGAASSPTASAASCRPSAPMRAASTPATRPSARCSRRGSPRTSSATGGSSPSPGRCCAGIERSEACPAHQPRRWRNATIF